MFAAQCRPPPTTIELNLQLSGGAAVRYLFAAFDGKPASGVVRHQARLVVAESTGPRPDHG